MALVLLNNNGTPYGQFDGYDSLLTTMLGGEVAMLTSYALTGSDKKASDINDGYVINSPQQLRPIVTTTMAGSATEGPLFLTDDGTANYGTLFGTLVGGQARQVVSGGTSFGPSTMSGSGKVTLWSNPGLYGVTLDALDATLVASTAVSVGDALFYTSAGKVCLTAQKVASARQVGRVVEFSTGDTLVNTPRSLTRVGVAGGTLAFKYLVMTWNPAL